MTRAYLTVVISTGRSWRRCRALDFLRRMWRAPCTRCITLPVLVTLNRFETIFLVFIFGIPGSEISTFALCWRNLNPLKFKIFIFVFPDSSLLGKDQSMSKFYYLAYYSFFLSGTTIVTRFFPSMCGSRTTFICSRLSRNRFITA